MMTSDMDALWTIWMPGEKWPRDSVFVPYTLEGEAARKWVKQQKAFRWLPRNFELRPADGRQIARDLANMESGS